MKRLALRGRGSLEWLHGPEPVVAADDAALVRPLAVATCDFDHLLVAGRMRLPLPIDIGHEFVAEVLAVGDAVTKAAPGQAVIVPFQVSCGSCENCQRGLTSACGRLPWLSCYGLGALGGGWGGAVYSDDEAQAAKAASLGARPLGSRNDVGSEAYDIVVDNSQDAEVLALAVRATAPAGALTSTTMYPDPVTPVPLFELFARGATFATGQPHARAAIDELIAIMRRVPVDVRSVTTSVVDWDDASMAFASGGGKYVCVRQ